MTFVPAPVKVNYT